MRRVINALKGGSFLLFPIYLYLIPLTLTQVEWYAAILPLLAPVTLFIILALPFVKGTK